MVRLLGPFVAALSALALFPAAGSAISPDLNVQRVAGGGTTVGDAPSATQVALQSPQIVGALDPFGPLREFVVDSATASSTGSPRCRSATATRARSAQLPGTARALAHLRGQRRRVSKLQITPNKKKPGKLLRYKRKVVVRAGTRKLFVRARDRAGNFSSWKRAK